MILLKLHLGDCLDWNRREEPEIRADESIGLGDDQIEKLFVDGTEKRRGVKEFRTISVGGDSN